MFGSKDDIATQVLHTERKRTLLFISMINSLPISILFVDDNDQETITRGVVHSVGGISKSQPIWKRAINGSFCFVSNEDHLFDINNIYAISFTELKDRRSFFKHKDALRATLHFDPYYIRDDRKKFTKEMIKLNAELDEEISLDEEEQAEAEDLLYGFDTKFYRILSSIIST